MTLAQIAAVLKQVANSQLTDTRTAIKAGQKQIAIRELDDGMRVLKLLATHLEGKG